MNRREALLRSAGLIAIGTAAIPATANATRHSHPTEYALNPSLWERPANLYRDRRLAAAFAHIRIDYDGPIGSRDFPQTVFQALGDAFGRTSTERVNAAAMVHMALQDSARLNALRGQINDRLDAKQNEFITWLNSIGIENELLHADLLNAQAVFAVAVAVNLGNDDMSYATRFTWIWPFC